MAILSPVEETKLAGLLRSQDLCLDRLFWSFPKSYRDKYLLDQVQSWQSHTFATYFYCSNCYEDAVNPGN